MRRYAPLLPACARRYATAANPTPLKSTLILPKTTFPIRPAGDASEHSALLRKSTTELYALQSKRTDRNTFIVHDGPPYANGDLHMGHALNKILKDIVNRVAVLEGKRVVYIPGWDCHGLPIELKALQKASAGSVAEAVERGKSMTPLEIRRQAKQLAEETVQSQMARFKEWAVMGEYEKAYKTMDLEYELLQLEVFKDMVKHGLVYRRFKPVYWSPSSGTALAEAELEYNEKHVSKAAFVKMRLKGTVVGEDDVSVVIWTTTPWTLPANKMVAVGEDMGYSIVNSAEHGKLLVADERVQYMNSILGEDTQVLKSGISGKDLVGLSYTHPLLPSDAPAHPIISADFVSADSGTGLVHLAPGHGMDDYLVCLSHGIAPFSPVDNNGRYTADTLPELEGQEVLYKGSKTVLHLLVEANALLHLHSFSHKYPYDWRTKLPVIVRATAQWFADAENIKSTAVSSLDNVRFIPESGRPRLTAFVQNRNEWCISRQRAWGVPIPVLYDAETGEPLLTEQSVTHIISVLREKGTDAWFSPEVPDSVFVAPEYQSSGQTYVRGKETMDVWFDSGTSWATLSQRLGKDVTADLYLEGSDQHRGWFQSSLLTSIAARNAPPFKQILTHGFVLDAKGKKMSKSLGNVIVPADITRTKKNVPNIDILRLWVALSDFTKDVNVGPTVLNHINEVLRKARVTSRFLLGVLSDWDGTHIPYSDLTTIDKRALSQLHAVNNSVRSAAAAYNFSRAVTILAQYTSTDLSAFYLDVIKDRIYSDAVQNPERRSAQSTSSYILRNYVSLLSPFIPLLTQEVWAHAPQALLKVVPSDERDMLTFFTPPEEWANPSLDRDFAVLDKLHNAVKLGFERAKAAGRVKVNLQLQVLIVAAPGTKIRQLVDRYRYQMETLFIVSGVMVHDDIAATEGDWWQEVESVAVGDETAAVVVCEADFSKCPRCWIYSSPTVDGSELCYRCVKVLDGMGVQSWTV
ncbi:tRNA synthetases class I-domain-containing protein [Sphaerosporella brunnea]|uniref:Isoleucine--tRNA ligase, mitochondrial n=1 Tax=Sphaerosporella brunnea TaxID=1250544 RepID=A0A5J5F2C9_9PEZI|nr:tRNA synthetases class I-domain-containing protein [Sphaerosporella brunnea]